MSRPETFGMTLVWYLIMLTERAQMLIVKNGPTLCLALENVQSELFDMKTKYDEATSAKYVVQVISFL